MIIVRGSSIRTDELTEAEPILFCDKGAAYFYVESGIIENEMRVMKNWEITERPNVKPFFIIWSQGVQIPQELGDYLVAHQDHKIGAWLSAALDDDNVCEEMKADIRDWFDTLPVHQDNNQTPDETEQTKN